MQEYFTEAVVLDVLPNGDLDSRISLFTERFGKLVAKAKSARRITSKLAPHLQPGNVVQARLVEKNGLQITDALKIASLTVPPGELYLLGRLLAEAEPDSRLWQLLVKDPATGEARQRRQGLRTNGHRQWSWSAVLKVLGWDPAHASCDACGKRPTRFVVRDQRFFCESCASKVGGSEVLYIRS